MLLICYPLLKNLVEVQDSKELDDVGPVFVMMVSDFLKTVVHVFKIFQKAVW